MTKKEIKISLDFQKGRLEAIKRANRTELVEASEAEIKFLENLLAPKTEIKLKKIKAGLYMVASTPSHHGYWIEKIDSMLSNDWAISLNGFIGKKRFKTKKAAAQYLDAQFKKNSSN